MARSLFSFLFITCIFICYNAVAQKTNAKDSTIKKNKGIFSRYDSTKAYNPRIATIRSAIIPGWGQATNKKYWKIPIVYAALGTTAYIFIRNVKQFNEAKAAYINATDNNPLNDTLIPQPYYSVKDQPERIRNFRNEVRQNVDYTVLFFIAFWGLNVVDATVDAHLKTFDVSDDLSLQIKPGYSQLANTNGISLVLHIGKKYNR
ncbi:MAG: hypothetical protein KF825_03485 [Ferruginibacter sp.]|nr:hypothetical protein [Ferruginibacter sp.]